MGPDPQNPDISIMALGPMAPWHSRTRVHLTSWWQLMGFGPLCGKAVLQELCWDPGACHGLSRERLSNARDHSEILTHRMDFQIVSRHFTSKLACRPQILRLLGIPITSQLLTKTGKLNSLSSSMSMSKYQWIGVSVRDNFQDHPIFHWKNEALVSRFEVSLNQSIEDVQQLSHVQRQWPRTSS